MDDRPPVRMWREQPPGTVVVAAGEFLRFGGFVNSMLDTLRPVGSSVFIKQSVSIVENLNDCIRNLPDHSEWIWIQADDHIWPNGALMSLLERDVDVVVPLIVRRSPPFTTLVFKDYLEGEGYLPFSFEELPEHGLVEVFCAGTGGMLVRRNVLEAVGWPKSVPWEERLWFEYEQGQRLNEDFVFCRKIREAGFKIHCDVEVQMGHRGMFTAWPIFEDGRWGLGLNMGAASGGKSNTIVIHSNTLEEVTQ